MLVLLFLATSPHQSLWADQSQASFIATTLPTPFFYQYAKQLKRLPA